MKQDKTHNEKVARTPGEKSFDLITYIGIGGVLNAAVSTVFFEKVQYAWKTLPEHKQDQHWGKRLKDTLDGWAQRAAKPFEPLLGTSNLELNTGSIKHFRRFVFGGIIGAGGWAVLAGIKPMEDNKQKIVESLNKRHGYEPSDEQIQALRNEPKQSWRSLLGGRTVAFLTPILAAAPILDVYEKTRGKEIFDDLADATRDNFGGKLKMEKYFPMKSFMHEGKEVNMGWERTKNLYAEVFYTGLAISLLYGVSKVISNKNEEPENPADLAKPLVSANTRSFNSVVPNNKVTDAQIKPKLTQEVELMEGGRA